MKELNKLAYYYHVVINQVLDNYAIPGYLGVFVDSLADRVEELYVIYHQANEAEARQCDYIIKGKNIRYISLGRKTPVWHRAIFYRSILRKPLEDITNCDALIVRSPSPLAPYFSRFFKKKNSLFLLVVGDYVDGAEHLKSSTFRDRLIYYYLHFYDYFFTKEIKKSNLIVNSFELNKKYRTIAKSIDIVKTTTLSRHDFYQREDTCQNEIIQLLYTGRLDVAKGLFELLEALNLLLKAKYNLRLNVVGWEQDEINRPLENKLKALSVEYGIENRLIFHGRKKIGIELNEFYQNSDIYVIPSYHEGFPRTIWEAMANSLPVIATSVGGIPAYLTHNENSFLIDAKDVNAIVDSIKVLIHNDKLRRTIIKNAFLLAKDNTLEKQTNALLSIIKNRVN